MSVLVAEPKLNLLSWRRKYSLCWAFFAIESMWLSHFSTWEMEVPRNLIDSTAATVLSMMVSGGVQGVCLEVHYHLHRFESVYLLSVSRLVSILDEADVIRKLQELDRGVLWSVVIGVEGEEQWGENTAQILILINLSGTKTIWYCMSNDLCIKSESVNAK